MQMSSRSANEEVARGPAFSREELLTVDEVADVLRVKKATRAASSLEAQADWLTKFPLKDLTRHKLIEPKSSPGIPCWSLRLTKNS
jgi:hypothetical protein